MPNCEFNRLFYRHQSRLLVIGSPFRGEDKTNGVEEAIACANKKPTNGFKGSFHLRDSILVGMSQLKKEPPPGEVLCISHAASFLSLDSVSVEVAILARPLAQVLNPAICSAINLDSLAPRLAEPTTAAVAASRRRQF
jgi:hypothetical protein